jgi:hypothetical protein
MKHYIHKPEINRFEFLDSRYYTSDEGNTYMPSVTEILSVYPKGISFNNWLSDVGHNAKEIVERAGEFGTKVHQASELLNTGAELKWVDENGNCKYSLEEWKCLLKYAHFWKTSGAQIVKNEHTMCIAELGMGGTLDLVVMINGKRWLIDIKTSNYLHSVMELQLAAYANMYNHENPDEQIEEVGILWLKASTRTDKVDHAKRIYQGHGYQLKTYDRHYNDAFKVFKHVQAIWLEENPSWKPANEIYPDTIKL